MREYILENCTREEIDKLEKSDIEWYPIELLGNDICICGTTEDFEKALKIIGRKCEENRCDTCKYAKWEWSESTSRFMVLDCKLHCYNKMAISGEDCGHYKQVESEEYKNDKWGMTTEEAIARIKNHKIVHKMNEPIAIYNYVSKALDMALEALEQINEIKKIIAIDNMVIQEDTIKYKMICKVLTDKEGEE